MGNYSRLDLKIQFIFDLYLVDDVRAHELAVVGRSELET